MDSDVSDVAETDAHILTFDIPDDALERAAAIAGQQAVTIGFCTHWYYCGWPLSPPPG
jgi:hypothetical protein